MLPNSETAIKDSVLLPSEINEAEKFWIYEAQRSLQPRIQNGELKSLSPFVDESEVEHKVAV